MVQENHGQPVVYNGNEQRADDKLLENIEKTSRTENGGRVRCSLELSSQRKPMEKAQAMFYMAFEAAKGDVGRWELKLGNSPNHNVRQNR